MCEFSRQQLDIQAILAARESAQGKPRLPPTVEPAAEAPAPEATGEAGACEPQPHRGS